MSREKSSHVNRKLQEKVQLRRLKPRRTDQRTSSVLWNEEPPSERYHTARGRAVGRKTLRLAQVIGTFRNFVEEWAFGAGGLLVAKVSKSVRLKFGPLKEERTYFCYKVYNAMKGVETFGEDSGPGSPG